MINAIRPIRRFEQDGEKGSRLFPGCLFPEQVSFYDIAAGAARQKLVVEHADEEEAGRSARMLLSLIPLDPQQDLPPAPRQLIRTMI